MNASAENRTYSKFILCNLQGIFQKGNNSSFFNHFNFI